MNESVITITQEEKESLDSIQRDFGILASELGQLHYQKNVIAREISEVEASLIELEAKRDALLQGIRDKYGEGILNINTGVLTPED